MNEDELYRDFNEIELEELAHRIFLKNEDTLPTKSVLVNFDVDDNSALFTRLIELFHIGSKWLYADENERVDIVNMSDEHLRHLEECMSAIGIALRIKRCKLEDVYEMHHHILGTKIYNMKPFRDLYLEDYEKLYPFDCVELADVIGYRFQDSDQLSDWRYGINVANKYYIVIYFDWLS